MFEQDFKGDTFNLCSKNTFYLCWVKKEPFILFAIKKKNFKHLLLEKDFSDLATNFSAFAHILHAKSGNFS
jgi:hypothetical protein